MDIDDLDGAPQDAAPEPSLRDTLMAAFQGADEAPATDLDAAPAPEGETDAQRAERLRDERGRFAKAEEAAGKPKDGEAPAAAAKVAPEAKDTASAPPEGAAEPAGEAALVDAPPRGWSPAAKAMFKELPPEIRQAVAQREADFERGIKNYREREVAYQGLESFIPLAQQTGTTLAQAFKSYRAAEELLAKDFGSGIRQLGAHYGHQHPVQVAAAALGMQPQHLLGMLQGGGAPQQAQPQPQTSPEIQRLEQQLNAVQSAVEARQRAEHEAALRQSQDLVSQFFADPKHLYASDCQQEILEIVERDPTRHRDPKGALERAYQEAVWRNPSVRTQLIKEQTAAQQEAAAEAARAEAAKKAQVAQRARQAARSITGSPTPGASAADAPADSLREELRRNLAAARGQV